MSKMSPLIFPTLSAACKYEKYPPSTEERKKKLYLYLQIHVCPRCCWSAWVYGKQQAWPSTARRWPGCPGGYTSSWASRGRPCPPPSSGNCGTCSGSRPPPRCPSAGCIWLFYRGRLFALWTEGTSSCGEKHTRGVNTPRYKPNTTAHYPATFEQIWQKRRWGKNAALVQAEILQLSDILLQSCTQLGDSNAQKHSACVCVCVSVRVCVQAIHYKAEEYIYDHTTSCPCFLKWQPVYKTQKLCCLHRMQFER